jgi:hypothetical protein
VVLKHGNKTQLWTWGSSNTRRWLLLQISLYNNFNFVIHFKELVPLSFAGNLGASALSNLQIKWNWISRGPSLCRDYQPCLDRVGTIRFEDTNIMKRQKRKQHKQRRGMINQTYPDRLPNSFIDSKFTFKIQKEYIRIYTQCIRYTPP